MFHPPVGPQQQGEGEDGDDRTDVHQPSELLQLRWELIVAHHKLSASVLLVLAQIRLPGLGGETWTSRSEQHY